MSYGFRARPFGFGPRPRHMGPRPLMGMPMMGQPRWGQAFAQLQSGPPAMYGGFDEDAYDEYGEDDAIPMHLVTVPHVKEWLARQHPMAIREIMFHSRWLLEKMGFPLEDNNEGATEQPQPQQPQADTTDFSEDSISSDMSSWYAPFKIVKNKDPPGSNPKGPPAKKGKKHPGLGYQPGSSSQGQSGQMQWTPEGWVPKDNSHKVTTTMKPLPKLQIVPPMSVTYPDAVADRDKLRMLENNVNMMNDELRKICMRFNIRQLDRNNLDPYAQHQKDKLNTAITCVSNAEKTLADFKEFLKTDKYKEWNEAQEKQRAEEVKQMIGTTPDGVPHKRPSAAAANDDEEDEAETANEAEEGAASSQEEQQEM